MESHDKEFSPLPAEYEHATRDELEERYNANLRDSDDDFPKEFGSDELALVRKAVWQAVEKYKTLSEEDVDESPKRARYWAQKHDEMLTLWEKFSGVAKLVEPPF